MSIDKARHFEFGIVAGIILIDVLFAAMALLFLENSRVQYRDRLEMTSHNLVQLLEQSIADRARLIDDAVVRVQRELERQIKAGDVDGSRLEQFLQAEQEQLPEIDAIRVTDSAGDIRWGKGVFPGSSTTYADREFFKQHRRHTAKDLIITEPIKGKVSGIWVIAFTRCYYDHDGLFAGVISAAVPLVSFGKLLASVNLGKTDTVVLRYADTGLIARVPPLDGPKGQPGNKMVSAEFSQVIQSGLEVATFHTAKTPDSVERTYAFRRVSGWPFTIAVGRVEEEYLSPWRAEVLWVGCLFAVFLVLTSVFGWTTVRYLRQRRKMEYDRNEDMTRRRILIEQSRDGIVVIDQQGKVWEANRRFTEMLGYSPEEVRQLHVWDWDVQWSREQILKMITLVDDSGDFFETRHRRKDGAFYHVEVSSNGALLGGQKLVFCVCRDISERKRDEEARRASEARFRALFDNNPDGVLVMDVLTRKCLMGNLQMCLMLGYGQDEIVDLGLGDLHPEEILPQTTIEFDSLSREKKKFASQTPVRRKDGSIFFADISAGQFEMGGRKCVVAQFRDITERKRLEDVLRHQEILIREAGEIAHFGGWEFDSATMKQYLTEEAARVLNLEPGVPLGLAEVLAIFRDASRDRLSSALETAIKTGNPYDLELELLSDAGRCKWIRMICNPLKHEGKVVRIHGSIQDISELKRAEEQQEELRGQLLQSQKMESVGRLAGGVAHDFNNIMGIILGYTDLILDYEASDEQLCEDLREIRKAAVRSADLTRQLLAFARKQTAVPKVLDLNRTIAGMLKMLRRLIGENIELSWLPEQNLWLVKIDPSQIDQILANLCINARDAFDGKGKITIETANIVFTADNCLANGDCFPGEFVMLSVTDDGCGMDGETLNKIFEPFFTTKGMGKGSGLGLATVYGVVRQNNGFIDVLSEPGHGTSFRIYIPAHAGEPAGECKENVLEPPVRGHETVLLAEDEPAMLNMTMSMLKSLGYSVLAAKTPMESIALAKEYSGPIHLLVTDVIMPEMNGRDLAVHIRKLYPNMKCLFMSGYTADVVAHHGVLEENVNFIQKPFSKQELAAKLRSILAERKD